MRRPPQTGRRRTVAVVLFVLVLLGAGCDQQGIAPPPEKDDPPELVPKALDVEGAIRHVHDPVVAEEGGTYYLFSTGAGISIRRSADLVEWESLGRAFGVGEIPPWADEVVPGVEHLWAPDIAFFNGRWHLYYSVSSFGSNRSAIGLATNRTLDPSNPEYEWVDRGKVVESYETSTYNAIDPNVAFDEAGRPWLAFGSFWSGIKMRRLNPETGKPSDEDQTLYSLAFRPDHPQHAIEAPYILRKDDYYYLFVAFDFCCRGVNSTYHVRVGRSREITGPYVDRGGTPMRKGGGTLVVTGTDRWRGPGHPAVVQREGEYLLVYHSYDAYNGGIPTLRISPLSWESGWPAVPMTAK